MSKLLKFFLCAMLPALALSSAASAQERIVPDSRAQVSLSFAPLVKKVAPAVVNIYTKRTVTARMSPFAGDPFFEQFFGQRFGQAFGGLSRQQVENSLGSGVIAGADGLVVTNAHVAKDADEIRVVLSDGREFTAKKALVDEPSDLAILRIDTKGAELPYVTFKASETLEVGDLVLAIGNPFGVGQTVTSGIVSALARSSLNISDFNFFIQTDAAINPGNSGGPLVAMDGSVVGINSAIYSRDGGSLGIGFAVPSEMVLSVIAAEKGGKTGARGIVRPWLGVSAQSVTQDIADSLGLKTPGGVLISDLHKASPARKAGLQAGDVVTRVNGRAVREPGDMKFRMATVPVGDTAVFTVIRKGAEEEVKVQAAPPPDDPPRQETLLSGRHPFDGATVGRVNPAVATELDIEEEEGVAVLTVDRQGQAARFLRPGDVIVGVNRAPIKTVKDLQKAAEAGMNQGWLIVLSRGGQKQQVIVR